MRIHIIFFVLILCVFNSHAQSLYKAYCKRDLEKFKRILELNPDAVSESDPAGYPLFIRVARNNSFGFMQAMIEAGADAGMKDNEGKTALMFLSANGNLAAVEFLLSLNIEVDQADTAGNTALFYCMDELTIFDYLIDKGGANINHQNHNGSTILMGSTFRDDVSLSKHIVEKGADINIKDHFGQTALFYCFSVDIVEYLIHLGVETDLKDLNNETPLHVAAFYGAEEVVKLLIEHGASIESKDNLGWDALYNAVAGDNFNLVSYLINLGANPNAISNDGTTHLMEACYNLDYQTAQLLISKGTDVNASDIRGFTPMFYIFSGLSRSESNLLQIKPLLQLLIDNGADLDARDEDGNTPLIFASSLGLITIAEYMISQGADPTIKNVNNVTAFDISWFLRSKYKKKYKR